MSIDSVGAEETLREEGEELHDGLLVSDVVEGVEMQANKPELFRPVVEGPNAEVKCGAEVSCCEAFRDGSILIF